MTRLSPIKLAMKSFLRIAFWGFFLLTLGCTPLLAQQDNWQLKDQVTGEPIPFATVLTGRDKGTISNEEGYFSLDPAAIRPDGVRISCMGYRTLELDRKQFEASAGQLRMEPAPIELNEVQLGTRIPGADEIIRLVRERIPVNYPGDGASYQLFYRESEFMKFEELTLELEKASDLNRAALQQADARLRKLGEDIVNSNARKYLLRTTLLSLRRAVRLQWSG